MKKIKIATMAVIVAGLNCVAVFAGPDHDMKPYVGSKEFEQIKALQGHWEGTTTEMAPDPTKPMLITVDYHVTSGGSAVVETLFGGTPHEMVTVYTDEKNKLAVTHYCMMQNQPHMILTKSNGSEISLEVPAHDKSVEPKSCHMHSLSLDVSKPNQLTQKWTSYDNGKAKPVSVFTFTRKS